MSKRNGKEVSLAYLSEILYGERALVIMSALPGSGKTTLAKAIQPVAVKRFSSDDFFYRYSRGGEYNYDANLIGEAHRSCAWSLMMAFGVNQRGPLVVHNTSTCDWEISPYVLMAKAMHWKPLVLTIHADIAACMVRQKHGVPETTMQIMAQNMAKPDRVKLHWEHVEITDKEAVELSKLLNETIVRQTEREW